MNIKIKEDYKRFIVEKYGEPANLDELAVIVKNICMENAIALNSKLVGFAWAIDYNNYVTTSHHAPIKRNSSLISSNRVHLPGFVGRVWVRYSTELCNSASGSNCLRGTLTYPGTGGFGSYNGPWKRISSMYFKKCGYSMSDGNFLRPLNYSWDYIFFAEDWPGIELHINKLKLFQTLKGVTFKMETHQYTWIDPETKAADDQFLLEIWSEPQCI